MKRISLFLTGIFICLFANGCVICDTTCHAPEDEFRNYAVVSPVGRSMVKHIEQAPRLTTLDNKTIAVVGVSFMAHITHPEIKRLIEENYKNVTVPCMRKDSTPPLRDGAFNHFGKLGANAVSGSAVVIDQNRTIFKNLLSFI